MGGILKLGNQDTQNSVTPTFGNINSTFKTGNDVIINDNNHTLMNIPNKISSTEKDTIDIEYDDKTNIRKIMVMNQF